MKIVKCKWAEITAYKAGHGERFHWKVYPVPHRGSMASMTYEKEETYRAEHFFVVNRIQFFWLWFVVDIILIKERLSDERYVRYDATHYAAIDEALSQPPVK
jgi:hypothetical protein